MTARDELVPVPRRDAGRSEVEALLPHREPFLFVDAIVSRDVTPDGGRITVAWRVPPDADFFRGHYPEQPVTPGVLLAEHAFQGGALLVALALGGFSNEDGVPVLTRIRDARFKRMVEPGDRLETEVVVHDRVGPAWSLKATVRCEGALVLKIAFALSATAAMARVTGEGGTA